MRIFGKRRFVVLAFSLLVLFWGSAFAMVEIGLYYSPPVLFAGLRTVIGGLAMVVAALLWGGSPNLRRDWPVFLLLALFNVVLFIAFQTYAIVYLPSGSAAVLVYLQPILVGFLAWLILGEELSASKLVGLLLGFSGIVAVSSASLSGAADALSPRWSVDEVDTADDEGRPDEERVAEGLVEEQGTYEDRGYGHGEDVGRDPARLTSAD